MNELMTRGYRFAKVEMAAGRIADLRQKVEEASDFGAYDDFDRGIEKAIAEAEEQPEPETLWRHHNGNVYIVLVVANVGSERDEYPPTVVYRGANGLVWAKPLSNFLEKMTRC